MMKPYSTLGQVTLGSQLRMLADAITTDASAIYSHFDLAIDAKWFPVFYVLASENDSTVTSIATTISHSHVSVSKTIAELEAAKLTVSKKSPTDSRRTLINLSREGKKLVPKLEIQCQHVDDALKQLSAETGINLGLALAVTRQHLRYYPLSERVKSLGKQSDLKIIDYAPHHADDFKRLNVEWITRYWKLEAADEESLNCPTQYIIDKGGAIFIALFKNEPVGSVALIHHNDTTLELAKMAVSPAVQGKGIGLALGQFALERAQKMRARRVFLESNSKLSPALALYRKLGFTDIIDERQTSPYERCNVRMEIYVGS